MINTCLIIKSPACKYTDRLYKNVSIILDELIGKGFDTFILDESDVINSSIISKYSNTKKLHFSVDKNIMETNFYNNNVFSFHGNLYSMFNLFKLCDYALYIDLSNNFEILVNAQNYILHKNYCFINNDDINKIYLC